MKQNTARNIISICLRFVFQDLEEQVAQDDGTAQALRADALKQENASHQLRRAVKEVAF